MDKKVAALIFYYIAVTNAGLIPIQSAKILEGPSTRTKVIGPDGSLIDAYAPGGKIVLEENAGPLLQAAPVVLAQPAVAEPHSFNSIEYQQIVLTEPALPRSEQPKGTALNPTPDKISRVSEDGQRIFLHPGTPPKVETRDAVPVTEETDESPNGTSDAPATTEQTTYADLSGAYIPDQFEQLFDDGSYRPEHY